MAPAYAGASSCLRCMPMAVYVSVLIGQDPQRARALLATADPDVVSAVLRVIASKMDAISLVKRANRGSRQQRVDDPGGWSAGRAS